MELLLTVREKGAVDSIVAFPFGVKPRKGSLIGFHAKDSLNHVGTLGEERPGCRNRSLFSSVCCVGLPSSSRCGGSGVARCGGIGFPWAKVLLSTGGAGMSPLHPAGQSCLALEGAGGPKLAQRNS